MVQTLAFLKAPDHEAFAAANDGRLPYGIDHLEMHGFHLCTTEAHHRPPFTYRPVARVVRRIERATTALLQTVLLGRSVWRAPVTLAMFESEGHFLALVRSLTSRLPRLARRRRTRGLVIIACWLTELCETATPETLARYRRLYRHVDRIIVFSPNQRARLSEWLEVSIDRIIAVPFGIDARGFDLTTDDDGTVLAVGRDKGRDWPDRKSVV